MGETQKNGVVPQNGSSHHLKILFLAKNKRKMWGWWAGDECGEVTRKRTITVLRVLYRFKSIPSPLTNF